MPTFEIKIIDGTSIDDIVPLVKTAYADILAMTDGAIIKTHYQFAISPNTTKRYSVLIEYSYTFVPPPVDTEPPPGV